MSEQKCIDQNVHMSLLSTLKLHKHSHIVPSWYESSIRDPGPGWYGEKSIPSLDQLIVSPFCVPSLHQPCVVAVTCSTWHHIYSLHNLCPKQTEILISCWYSCWLVFFSWVVTSVGQFSLFCENQLGPVWTWCYENLISSLITFFGLVRTDQGINIFNFFKLTRYLDRAVLTYTIPIGFHILFSQPSCWIFH
jgi:hypothetical protein